MHQPIPEQGRWLRRVVRGYFNYHAVPTNARALDVFGTMSLTFGGARCGVAATRIGSLGHG